MGDAQSEVRATKRTYYITVIVLVLMVAFGFWIGVIVEKGEAARAVEAQERAATAARIEHLVEQVTRNQEELRLELLLHRCRKEVLMDLLLESHGIKVPQDPHPKPCPGLLR